MNIGLISFLQHNLNRQNQAQASTLELAAKRRIDIVLFQEPFTFQPSPTTPFITLSHPAYDYILPAPTLLVRLRVLAYIRKEAGVETNPRPDLYQDPDIQVIEIIAKEETFLVFNLYNEKQQLEHLKLDPSSTSLGQSTTLQRTLLLQPAPKGPWVLAGDFNLHHPSWNAIASSSPGALELVDWLQAAQATPIYDLEVINKLGGTFFRSNLTRTSVIDLAFIRGFRKVEWKEWTYLEPSGSDHEVIGFNARTSVSTRPPITRFNLKKTDWKTFKDNFSRKAIGLPWINYIIDSDPWSPPDQDENDPFSPLSSLDQWVDDLIRVINSSLEASTPKLRINLTRSKPWWTPELSEDRKRLNRLQRALRKDERLREEWKKARNSYF
jgi:endonuclease/exonuclease/phosphatase (EEP) superfamily protein YafD